MDVILGSYLNGQNELVLKDSFLAQALMDRLLHHGGVYYLQGNSYRIKGKNLLPKGKEKTPQTESAEEGKGK